MVEEPGVIESRGSLVFLFGCSPRSSSFDLQWTIRSIPEPKSLKICTSAFLGSSEKASVTTRSNKRWSRQVVDKGFIFGFDGPDTGTNDSYRVLK
ncbi:hypothetical protein V6N13_125985 [Hibiscus sabdariffa]